jgi:3-dehydroquinate synthase
VKEASGGPPTNPTRLRVGSGNGGYPVLIGPGLVTALGQTLRSLGIDGRIALISDAMVLSHWGAHATGSLQAAQFKVVGISLPAGEATKTLKGADQLYGRLIQEGFVRDDVVVALGGGVIGDLAGFVAATYHRGMSLVQVPTTLLAQVDSSIGGKVAVDHPLGKNLIGAFHSPRAVICDPTVLTSLGRRERWSGVAEVVKAALVADAPLVESLEKDLGAIGDGLASEARMAEVVEWAVRIKATIVSSDEREQGRRAILNFGHTLGHALEAVTGYGPLTHGEAVVIGMRVALEISAQLGRCSAFDAARALALLSRFPAPPPIPRPEREEVIAAARRDKKVRAGEIKFVVLTGIGKAEIEPSISAEMLGLAVDRALDEFLDKAP